MSPSPMILRFLCVSVFLLGFALPSATAAAASQKIEVMMLKLDADIRQLAVLSEELKDSKAGAADALQYRRDGRSFQLLSDLDALVAEVAELPDDSAGRQQAEQLLDEDFALIGQAIIQRMKELDQRIEASNLELKSLEGGARVSLETYVYSLGSIRFQYYDALISHFESRSALGMNSSELRDRLEAVLYLHAEKLAGHVEFSSSAQRDLQAQLELDPTNTDVESTLKKLLNRNQVFVSRLQLAIELLERLGIDSSDYKTVLVKGTGDLSIDMLNVTVVKSVFSDWWATISDAAASNAPDISFRLILFLAILLVFRILSRFTRRVVKRSCDSSSLNLSVLLKDILVSWSGGMVMVLGVFMALSQVGISLGPMLAGLGVAGFVIGFALQDTLGNFAAGAMILVYRPYDVDDFIEVASASGLVKNMNLVSTTITTFDNQTLVVPNSKIWGDVIKNVTAQKVRRVDMEFGIGYSDDIEHAERVFHDIVASHELTLKKPEAMIKLHSLGDSSVNFVVRPWTRTEDYWDVYWDITREVKMRFDREGISIPFPQRDVHIQTQGDASA